MKPRSINPQLQQYSNENPRLLLRVKRFDETTGKYGHWEAWTTHDATTEIYLNPETLMPTPQKCLSVRLKHGGNLRIFPELVSGPSLDTLVSEIDRDPLFRQYTIRNNNEPRLHYLLSSTPTTDDDGYHHCHKQDVSTTTTANFAATTSFSPLLSPQATKSAFANFVTPSPQHISSSGMKHFGSSPESSPSSVAAAAVPTFSNKNNETPPSTTTQSSVPSGYNYHGVKMEPVASMFRFPSVWNVSKTLGALAAVHTFSIGANVVLYRNGKDHIGWHSDDTHDEEKICCLVAVCPDLETTGTAIKLGGAGDSPHQQSYHTNCARPLQIRRKLPRKGDKPEHGDEFIEVWVGSGDAYEMDSEMQDEYEHSLPRCNLKSLNSEGAQDEDDLMKHRRLAIVFRHGVRKELEDSGKPVDTLTAPAPITPEQRHPLGSMPSLLEEGNIYTRNKLIEMFAHSSVQGGISGTIGIGCRAIVVSRQSKGLMEADNFHTLLYSSTPSQGSNAMFKSWMDKSVVRVFRSSALENPFRAKVPDDEKKKERKTYQSTMYRYDGLYRIQDVWETEHLKEGHEAADCPTPTEPGQAKQHYTFLLVRAGTLARTKDNNLSPNLFNKTNNLDIWNLSMTMGTLDTEATTRKYFSPLPCWLGNRLVVDSNFEWQGSKPTRRASAAIASKVHRPFLRSNRQGSGGSNTINPELTNPNRYAPLQDDSRTPTPVMDKHTTDNSGRSDRGGRSTIPGYMRATDPIQCRSPSQPPDTGSDAVTKTELRPQPTHLHSPPPTEDVTHARVAARDPAPDGFTTDGSSCTTLQPLGSYDSLDSVNLPMTATTAYHWPQSSVKDAKSASLPQSSMNDAKAPHQVYFPVNHQQVAKFPTYNLHWQRDLFHARMESQRMVEPMHFYCHGIPGFAAPARTPQHGLVGTMNAFGEQQQSRCIEKANEGGQDWSFLSSRQDEVVNLSTLQQYAVTGKRKERSEDDVQQTMIVRSRGLNQEVDDNETTCETTKSIVSV